MENERDIQSVATTKSGLHSIYPHAVSVTFSKHVPHWRVFERGYASIEFGMPEGRHYLSITAYEGYRTDAGRDSKMQTMLTLGPEAIEALRELLAVKP